MFAVEPFGLSFSSMLALPPSLLAKSPQPQLSLPLQVRFGSGL